MKRKFLLLISIFFFNYYSLSAAAQQIIFPLNPLPFPPPATPIAIKPCEPPKKPTFIPDSVVENLILHSTLEARNEFFKKGDHKTFQKHKRRLQNRFHQKNKRKNAGPLSQTINSFSPEQIAAIQEYFKNCKSR